MFGKSKGWEGMEEGKLHGMKGELMVEGREQGKGGWAR